MSGIENKLAGLSAEQRAFVELQLQKKGGAAPPAIARRQDDYPPPLSFAQQRLWLMSQLDPGSPAYVMPGAARLTGRLNLPALERALNAIVERHETLRTTFALAPLAGEEPRQMIQPSARVHVDTVDLAALPADAREAGARRIAIRMSREPFDLANGPLLRAAVVKLADDDHVLVLTAHHIVSDGWSMAIFVRELGELYRAFDAGTPASLPPLPIQYADFAVWQRQWLQGARLDAQVDYWKRTLAGVPVLQLPIDRPRPTVPGSDGAFESVTLPLDLLGRLKALSQAEGTTLFMTLLAGFDILLARYCDQDDVAVGAPIANRTRAEIEGLIGCFVNTLVMRADLSGDPTVRTLLARVRETALGAFAHQDLPFERLVDELQPERSVGQNPLFQVIFALQNAPAGALDLGGLVLGAFEFPITTTRFDLEMHLSERADGLGVRVCYRTDVFEPATMRRLLRHYGALLEAMARAPQAKISQLAMLDEDERRQLFALNPAPTPYPRESIVSVFEAQVRTRPDAIAVDYGNGAALTYRELDATANRLARQLRAAGVERGMPVGVIADRSPELIAGLIAILKAGGAYLPIDPDYPAERVQFMIRDSGLRVVIHHAHLRAVLPADAQRDLALVPLEPSRPVADEPYASVPVGPDDLAFIVYTSGSTGQPKGSALTHGGILRTVCNVNYMEITPDERISQGSSISFDAATFEIWAPLLNGGRLVGIEKNAAFSAAAIARLVADRHLTTLFVTTALFNQIARENPAAFAPLKNVLFGGEAVDSAAVAAVMRSGAPSRLVHMYGPSETTTYGTWYHVPRTPPAVVPIGRAVANTTVYVLDRALEPVPLGVTGELYIGGDGLSRGYLNRPALTAERFIPDPFGTAPGGRLYRTGDLVRWTHARQIEFVGRNDNQVKIRGFRIELGEIEAMLLQHPEVKEATVIARQDDGDRRLVAYIVPSTPEAASDGVRTFLRERLPDYMVPSAFVTLEAMPLTANGKIDRRALPAPAAERQLQQELVLPRTDLERAIAAAWREVLQIPEVGVTDNFFDLGGHSLRLLQVHGLLVKSLERDVAIVDLFRFPTIATLAAHLGAESSQAVAGPRASGRRRRIAAAEREPIAIIGMAGRFPGAPDVETYWENISNGVESIGHFTDDECRAAGISEELIANPNFVKAFGVVPGFDLFDAGFFGYSAREAGQMDPQHRHFLECAWEALERAGYDPFQYKGRIGIYGGCAPNLYLLTLLASVRSAGSGLMAMFMGNTSDYLPTRVSYKLNLRGPSVNVQNACSTALVALHHACQSLLSGECDMAMAGGVNMKRSLASGYVYEEGGILSPDGHCRSFDANARGTVAGSGVAIVVVKLLADAIADGDRIHAVIRSTALNNDGSDKVGFTAPGVQGQAAVIAAAHAAANIDPRSIGYIEAHGTGTLLGDPLEMEALTQAFGKRIGQAPTCAVGSVKSNIGHLDAAAGVAGLIKATMALEHRQIPPSLHFVSPNPKMRLDESPFYVSTTLHEWRSERGLPRRAGVSAFGIGGTNAHVVLEEAPPQETSSASRDAQLIVLSARSKAALDRATDRLATFLDSSPDVTLADVAFTLQTGRRRFRHRRMVVAESVTHLRDALQKRDPKRLISVDAATTDAPVAFVFPGQGAQAVDMGRGLYESEPVFRDAVDRCADLLRSTLDGDLRDVLYPSPALAASAPEKMRQTAWSQPAIFVVEYALAQLWQSWGVTPQSMIGHSLGEYVAACLAGVFTLEDALTLVAARGRMMQALAPGGMVAAPADEAAVRQLLTPGLSIASVNGPSATVVSGPFEEIETFERAAQDKGLTTRRLVTSHAFHSSMLDPMLASFEALVRQLRPQPPTARFISNVTGTWITTAEATDPAYWVTHLRGTVRFGDGLATLLDDGKSVPLEVGPGQGLTSLARRLVTGGGREAVASLPARSGAASDTRDIVEALGKLWLAGVAIDWAGFYAGERRHRLVLPTYPFERQQFQIDVSSAAAPAAVPSGARRPDVSSWLYTPSWRKASIQPGESAPADAWVLALADRDGIGAEVARAFANVAVVSKGARFEKLGDREYSVDPSRSADFEAVLLDLEIQNRFPSRVLHAWDSPDDEQGFETLLAVSHAFIAKAAGRKVDVAVLAGGLHAISAAERLAPRKALMIGLGRVVVQEHSGFRFRTIDVAPPDTAWARERAVDQIVAEVLSGSADPSVAYRGLERYVQVFDSVKATRSDAMRAPVRPGGVYLITGGLGLIGLTMAEHLAATAGARLVLVGRSGLPPRDQWDSLLASAEAPGNLRRRIERVKAIESQGGEVLVVSADVSRPEDLRTAIARAEERFGPLNGVIHAAARLELDMLRPVDGLSMEQCHRQFGPKVEATIALEEALGDRPLDFCLLMSSLSSILGGLTFGAYAAGNCFLDAFAHEHNRRHPTPWISVNWDGWLTDPAATAASSGPSALSMTHAEGMHALDQVLRLLPATQLLVSTSEIGSRIRQYINPKYAADVAAAAEPAAPKGRPVAEQGPLARRPLANWFYVPSWKRSVNPRPVSKKDDGVWLIFADDDGFAREVGRRAALDGAAVVTVKAAPEFARIGSAEFSMSPVSQGDYTKLFAELAAGPGLPTRIVHCWNVTTPVEDPGSADSPGFLGMLYLAQALATQPFAGPLPVHVFTSRASDVTGVESLLPEHALAVGALRVVGQEDPRLVCVHVDVESDWARAPQRHWDSLMNEIRGDDGERFVAYRAGHRWTQTFEALTLPAAPAAPPPLRERGVFLITGGFGGVGLAIASHIAKSAGGRLVLTSRRGLPARAEWAERLRTAAGDDRVARDIRAVQDLEASGAEVMVAAADVSDERAMKRVVAEALDRFGAIHGVVHAAGVAGAGLIQLKDRETAARVLAPKTVGTRTLARALEGQPLDFFVLCSSLASFAGGFGQIDYCAANNYLDVFARVHARQTGLPTMAINWDVWRDAGMAVETNLPAALRAKRQEYLKDGMSSEDAVEALLRALGRADVPQIAVSTLDLPARLKPRPASGPAEGEARQDEPQETEPVAATHARPELPSEYVAPQNDIERALCAVWEDVLGVSPIGVQDDFFDLGGHSLLALQLLSRMRERIGVDVAIHMIFNAPTVGQLAEVVKELGGVSTKTEGPDRAEELLAMIEELSEEELKNLPAAQSS